MTRAGAGAGLRVAVLGDPAGWHVGRVIAALANRGHEAKAMRWCAMAAVVGGTLPGVGPTGGDVREGFLPSAIDAADVIVVRGMPVGSLEEVVFRMDLLARLAARGTIVANSPRGLEIAIDKYLSLARLAAAGLPVPHTVVAQDPATIEAAWQGFGRDCVAKPLFGSCGRGLVRVADTTAVADLCRRYAPAGDSGGPPAAGGVAYLQEFVPHHGWDVRVLLVGDEAFAIRRVAADGEWRTNLSVGGRGVPFTPPAEWLDLARRAAAVAEAGIAGVDLLPARDGRVLVLEVNAVPGWRGLESATGVDVAARVAGYLERLAANADP